MGREVSLMVTARDNYSSAMEKMTTTTKGFESQMKQLDSQLTILNRNKATLQVDATKAKSELAEAKKQFAQTGDEASRLNLIAKQTDYNNITDSLKLVSDYAKQTQSEMKNCTDELNRFQNRADSGGGGMGAADSLLSRIGAAGATQMIGSAAQSAITTYASSMLGDRGGEAFSSVLENAISGASIGMMVAGPVGAAVGALGGAALGGIQAAINDYKIQDDAFKGAVQDLYQSAMSKVEETAQSGSTLASSRETARASFNTLLGGSESAAEFLSGIQEMANRTPFLYDELTGMSKSLLASGFSAESLMPMLTTMGNAGGVLGMTTSDIDMLAGRLGYMQQSDRVTLELLKPFVTRGVKAFDYLADAQGVSVEELLSNLSDLSGREAVNTIMAGMTRDYEGGMELLASTYEGLSGTVEELQSNLGAAYGEAYNLLRMEGLAAERDWLEREDPQSVLLSAANEMFAGLEPSLWGSRVEQLSNMEELSASLMGGGGAGMAEWQSQIGAAHAELENTAEAVRRGVMDAFMTGDMAGLSSAMGEGKLTDDDMTRLSGYAEQFASAMAEGNGFEMEALLGIAETEAETLMASTDIAKAQHEAQVEMIEGIRAAEEANNLIAERSLDISNELSKGFASVRSSIDSSANRMVAAIGGSRARGLSNAWGQYRVPYDGYFAELHEGERVLTAQEARAGTGGAASVSVVVQGNLVVREEADVGRIAAELARELALARSVVI